MKKIYIGHIGHIGSMAIVSELATLLVSDEFKDIEFELGEPVVHAFELNPIETFESPIRVTRNNAEYRHYHRDVHRPADQYRQRKRGRQ